MNEIMLSVSYESLGKILEEFQVVPEIKDSPEITSRLRDAILFHQRISVDWQGLLQEHRKIQWELSNLTRESGERVCNRPLPNEFGEQEQRQATQ